MNTSVLRHVLPQRTETVEGTQAVYSVTDFTVLYGQNRPKDIPNALAAKAFAERLGYGRFFPDKLTQTQLISRVITSGIVNSIGIDGLPHALIADVKDLIEELKFGVNYAIERKPNYHIVRSLSLEEVTISGEPRFRVKLSSSKYSSDPLNRVA